MRISFKLKLILSYFFLIFISLGFVAFFLDKNLEEKALQEIKTSLINESRLIESIISNNPAALNSPEYLDKISKDLGSRIKSRITILNITGKVLADSEVSLQQALNLESHLGRPEVAKALKGKIGEEIRYSSTLKIDMLYLAVPIKENGVNAGILRLALPLTSVQKVLFAVRKTIIIGLFFTLGLAFVLASVLAKTLIKPINRIIYISSKFSQGDFSRRIFQSSNDEIGLLAATLNKMAQDIEEKIREVATKNQHLEAIFNSMIEGVIVTDESSRVISINHAIESLFDAKGAAIEGKFFLEGIRNSEISELINNAMNSAKLISKEVTLIMPVQRVVQVNVSPIFQQDKVTGSVIVIHDITEIRRLETMRRDFVANVSHELKTPLTSIKGFVETLLEGAAEDRENRINFLKIINNHVDRLSNLINDLLELSHIESKEIELLKNRFDLSSLVDEVVMGNKSQARKKGVEIKSDLPQGLEILADSGKIEQVLVNLVNNAIKYNKDKGFVRIYSEQLADTIKIVVEDSGSGIPAKDIPRIFERFYRVDKARSRELGGTGLGLSIVKHIIELHSGSVGVESVEGLGSKFWFTIPNLI
ncbi:MAG: ATP-binding protein [Candidatus Omnitrophica bacterium]|jgi:two-component system phosphate regulon sensor histidine kinase PhoR|nr:ATP-binding protein [Candidatus Omnitrophota bacterium]